MSSWREGAHAFTEIGRCLEQIEDGLRHIRMTAVVDDRRCRFELAAMYTAANKLVSSVRSLRTLSEREE